MFCEECGAHVEESMRFCPSCGCRLVDEVEEPVEEIEARPAKERRLPIWIWYMASALLTACLLLSVMGVGAAGVYQGLQERAVLNRESAVEHYNRGVVHLEAGRYDLAVAEFELALRLAPDYREAKQGLDLANSRIAARVTPTSEIVVDAAGLLFDEAQKLYDEGQWDEAALKLEQLRGLDPSYRQNDVGNLLFSIYFNQATQLVNEDRMEEALRAFDKALDVKPADADALRQRDLASRYITAVGYWDADWEQAIAAFSELYQMAPGYKDVEARLVEAYVSYGDVYTDESAWCLAQQQYTAAAEISPDAAIEKKRDTAAYRCRTAPPEPAATPTSEGGTAPAVTPTEAAPAEGTPVATAATEQPEGTPPVAAEATAPAGPITGKIAFASFNAPQGIYEAYVINADGSGRTMIAIGASQLAFSPDGTKLAYHSWEGNQERLRVMDAAGGGEIDVTNFVEDIGPSWSPDGTQLVFASNRSGDRKWRIYLTSVYKDEDERELAFGQSPDWSSTGAIVYKGCNEQGYDCGLYVVSSAGGASTPLTNDPADSAPDWSPDGSQVAFMSNRDGDWEVYVVGAGGGEPQRLTNQAGNDGLPEWSPDGRHIAFVSDRGGGWAIWVMNTDGSGQRKLFDLGGTFQDWFVEQISWTR